MRTIDAVVAAAERLNRANVRDAINVGTRNGLYRDNMSADARKLDEAFQAYYEAQRPRTDGPQPLPPIGGPHIEIDAKAAGFTLEMSEETRREIEQIEQNAAMARLNAGKFILD